MNNPFNSTKFFVNTLTPDEYHQLKASLLNKTIKIIADPNYGLFTEHGFPVAIATYRKFKIKEQLEFYAKIITTEPMLTIYEIPERA
ncbi:MAG: hypothetical protein IJ880_11500 [Bacilli bacterium]|nr:hypothetical protein [Bacilli bacterium]